MDYQVNIVLIPSKKKNKQTNKQKLREKVYGTVDIKGMRNLA